MADQREMILERIKDICLDVKTADASIISSVRNRGLLANEKRPGVILLDGDESPVGGASVNGGRNGYFRPTFVEMKPELYILLEERRLQNANVGADLNALRNALCVAITTDAQLAVLLGGPNGKVIYNGCVTDLKSGSALTGQMRLDFAYRYWFKPA
jgi:hypothetical protein